MKCKYCQRELPNKEHQTKNGCKWCDIDLHQNKGDKNAKC